MIERLFQTLRPGLHAVVKHPLWVILGSLLLTGAGLWATLNLRIDSDFSNLIPPDYSSVQALDRLRATIGGESEAAVVIESPSFEANKRFAEVLIPEVLALQGTGYKEPYFTRADFRHEMGFLRDNALYFATEAELDSLQQYLEDEIEQARLEANPFYFELEDEEVEADSLEEMLQTAYDLLLGNEYPISEDSTVMAIRFYPSGAQTNIGFIEDAYRDLEQLVVTLEPTAFHPDMEVTLAGRLLRQLVEVQVITQDVQKTFGAGVLMLMVMVVAYFFYKSYQVRAGQRFSGRVLLSELARTPVTALLLGFPLLASEAWTFGLAFLIYGSLNLMTSTLGLVLFGMGIDFGIHFYARYAEERGQGRGVAEAVEQTFMTTGQAITVVALTTAAAFFILMLADFRGFSEFGFIAGTGILLALLAMIVLLPALLVFFEQMHLLNLMTPAAQVARRLAAAPSPTNGYFATRRPMRRTPRLLLVLSFGAIFLALTVLPQVAFEYNFSALAPEYEAYNALQRKARLVYSDHSTRNAAYILTDHPAEATAVTEALRAHVVADTLTPTVRAVEYLQDRFPMAAAAQQAKLQHLEEIRRLLEDPFLEASDSEELDRLRQAASTQAPIALAQVPDFIKRPFMTKEGAIGHLVIIYPSVGLSDGRKSMQFSDDVGTVTTVDGTVYHAGSTSLVAADMLRLMQREAPLMVGLTLLMIVGFKLFVLQKLRWVLLALLPLAASFLWMFGLMVVLGLKLTFYNLVVLPTVLGIGDDSGIHLVHRYREEGRGSIRRVLRSTGEHITISALTTMVGFGGLLFSMHPGMRSIGEVAVLGIGLTLVAALVFLPALLAWMEAHDRSAQPSQQAKITA